MSSGASRQWKLFKSPEWAAEDQAFSRDQQPWHFWKRELFGKTELGQTSQVLSHLSL